MRPGRKRIEQIVNQLLQDPGRIQASLIAQTAGISRQAAHRHLAALVKQGVLRSEGKGPATHYVRSRSTPYERKYRLSGLSEDVVWNELSEKAPPLERIEENLRSILACLVTELINNAIDHS